MRWPNHRLVIRQTWRALRKFAMRPRYLAAFAPDTQFLYSATESAGVEL